MLRVTANPAIRCGKQIVGEWVHGRVVLVAQRGLVWTRHALSGSTTRTQVYLSIRNYRSNPGVESAIPSSSARTEPASTDILIKRTNARQDGMNTGSFNDLLSMGIQQQAREDILKARKANKKKKLSVRSKLRHRDHKTMSGRDSEAMEIHQPFAADHHTSTGNEILGSSFAATNDEWDRSVDHLLDPVLFPIGFSGHDSASLDSWFEQAERALNQTTPHTADKAFCLLDRWLQEERANPLDVSPCPVAIETVDWVVGCWSRCVIEHGIKVVSPEDVWTRVAQFHTPNGTSLSLATILVTIGHIEAAETAPYRGEEVLSAHLEMNDSSTLSIGVRCLNTVTINSLMRLWYKSRLPESPESVDRWLRQLDEWHQLSHRTDQKPDDVTYATVLATWMSVAPPGAAVHRADLLMRQVPHAPSFVLYSTIVEALAKAGHVERAHKVLNAFLKAQERALYSDTRTVAIKSFDDCHPVLSILEAYKRRVDRQPTVARVQMERFISQMESIARKSSALRAVVHPNVACYSVLVDVYTQLRAPHRAEGLLRHVLRLRDSDQGGLLRQSLTPLWNGVLESWAQSGDADSVPRATALIQAMEAKYKLDRLSQPNAQTYTLLLFCVANDRRNAPAENARLAHELLSRMEREQGSLCKPTGESYDVVLLAWCKAGYPDQADSLLHSLCGADGFHKEPTETGYVAIYPTALQFITVMYGWAKIARRRNGQHRVLERVECLLQTMHAMYALGYPTKPSLTAYNIFLECLVKSSEIDAPERAESFLRLLEKANESDDTLLPDAVVFNSILTAWLRSNRNDAPAKAAALFRQMKCLHATRGNIINSFTYTTLMGIYAQHTLPEKAQEMFDEMRETKALFVRAPFSAYTTLINAWAVAGKPDIAQATVEDLRREYMQRDLLGPSKGATLALNAVLHAWALSKDPDATTKAEFCLDTMDLLAASGKFDIRPNLMSYSFVIKTLARSGHRDAGQRALHVFDRMRTSYMETGDPIVRPDLNVYVDIIAALVDEPQTDSTSSVPCPQHVRRLLDEIDSLVHPSCWMDQGKLAMSRIAWHAAESGFETCEKEEILQQLERLAKQHGVKLDRTIAILFKQNRLASKEKSKSG